jgi:hypothetical protein
MNKILKRMKKLAGDFIFDVIVRRLDNGKEVELKLPTNNLEAELKKGLGEDYSQQDYEIVNFESDFYCEDALSLKDLNATAEIISHFSDNQKKMYQALTKKHYLDSEDALYVIMTGDCYILGDTEIRAAVTYCEILFDGDVTQMPKDVLEDCFNYEDYSASYLNGDEFREERRENGMPEEEIGREYVEKMYSGDLYRMPVKEVNEYFNYERYFDKHLSFNSNLIFYKGEYYIYFD